MEAGQVIAMSRLASQQGVRVGMRSAGVQAVAPEVILQEREPVREQAVLDAVALSLLQYTPELAAAPMHTLLLDVSASLSAFSGRWRLCRRVRDSVHALGCSFRLGMAPTALGAWLLAHRYSQPKASHGRRRRLVSMLSLHRELDRLPFELLPATARHAQWLTGIGCSTLADLRRLPRAGLQRRTDARLLEQLDRAYGEAPELFEWLQAPEQCDLALELPHPLEQAEQLLFGAHHLLTQMTGWLVARQQAVSRFTLVLEHERGRIPRPPTLLELVLAEPAWQEAHLLRLTKERLARLPLPAAVIGLRLQASQITPWTPSTEQLFPEPGGSPQDYRRLLELLMARLGPQAVQLPAAQEDHRPECANHWRSDSLSPQGHTPAQPTAPLAARPFWLLEQPLALSLQAHRPFYGSALRLLSGPERIESGWWDGALVLRDYFVAQGEEGACYWIYRERDAGSARWFLHGLFA
jgi:protein ImuB